MKRDDVNYDETIRPRKISDYVGQENVKDNIDVFIKAAKKRNESLDHILFYGPPGLGKTTLANIIANELDVNIKHISGPSIEKIGDLATILTTIEPGDVVFIDEIHRMPRIVEEILYPAMEDFVLDIIIGQEGNKKSIRIELPPFTLVGATTKMGLLSRPLCDRFGVIEKMEYYSLKEISKIIERTSNIFDIGIDEKSIIELSKRSRGTPRIANRIFKRVRDFAEVENDGVINHDITKSSLKRLKIDSVGLNNSDLEYLNCLIKQFKGGPVGIDSLSSVIGEDTGTLEDAIEPYLLKEGFITRTQRGRIATEKTYKHLRIKE